jgi:hypothetical protein
MLRNSKTGIITYLLQIGRWLSCATGYISHAHTNKNLFMKSSVDLWLEEDQNIIAVPKPVKSKLQF